MGSTPSISTYKLINHGNIDNEIVNLIHKRELPKTDKECKGYIMALLDRGFTLLELSQYIRSPHFTYLTAWLNRDEIYLEEGIRVMNWINSHSSLPRKALIRYTPNVHYIKVNVQSKSFSISLIVDKYIDVSWFVQIIVDTRYFPGLTHSTQIKACDDYIGPVHSNSLVSDINSYLNIIY